MSDPPKVYRCEACHRLFKTPEAVRTHAAVKHIPGRDVPNFQALRAKDRPRQRGDFPCGVCDMTFETEHGAADHRRAKHGSE